MGSSQVPVAAGRVAVITGASRGLGAGLAQRFAEAGMSLGLCARHEPAVPAAADDDEADDDEAGDDEAVDDAPTGARAVTGVVDVSDPVAVDRFGAAVADRFGRIDVWVNNAGVLDPIGPLRDLDPDAVAAHVAVNLLGVLHGSATFARHVRSRSGGGVLVNMTSGAATNPYEGWSAYCSTKAAVDQATRVVAAEEGDAGLRAYAVSPGIIDTDMQTLIRATPPERFPRVERFLRLKRDNRYSSPAWVADHILRLVVDPPEDAPVVQRVPDEPRPA